MRELMPQSDAIALLAGLLRVRTSVADEAYRQAVEDGRVHRMTIFRRYMVRRSEIEDLARHIAAGGTP